MASDPTAAEVRELKARCEECYDILLGDDDRRLPGIDHRDYDRLAQICRLALAVLEPGESVDIEEGLRLQRELRECKGDTDDHIAAAIRIGNWRRDNTETALLELARLRAENAELRKDRPC